MTELERRTKQKQIHELFTDEEIKEAQKKFDEEFNYFVLKRYEDWAFARKMLHIYRKNHSKTYKSDLVYLQLCRLEQDILKDIESNNNAIRRRYGDFLDTGLITGRVL